MIPNLTTITILMASSLALILITFLPAFIELKKPKDEGPRMIMAKIPGMNSHIARFISLANIEDEQAYDGSLSQKMVNVIAVLPSLEA
jgi:hypothetical protein